MKRLSLIRKIILTCLVLSALIAPAATLAQAGLPAPAGFSYGARVDPWGQQVEAALSASSEAGLDWVSVDFDWKRHWPEMSSTMNLIELDRLMTYAAEHGLQVMLSISHAPDWALTERGPDPELTAGLVAQLIRLYPKTLLAVELFPSANTLSGWGMPPDPEAYSELLRTTARTLKHGGWATLVVAAGLEPLAPGALLPDMDDLAFLQRLYSAGAANHFSVIGIRIPQTDQEALAPPWKVDPRVLRRYESVRSVMLKNQHSRGQIWITGFSMPSAQPVDAKAGTKLTSPLMDAQVRWLNQALRLTRSQLYIGAVFYACMNPPASASEEPDESACLIQSGDRLPRVHPAYQSLEEIISLDKVKSTNQAPTDKNSAVYSQKNLITAGTP